MANEREVWVIELDGKPLESGISTDKSVVDSDCEREDGEQVVRYVPAENQAKGEWVKPARYEPKTLQQKLGYLVEECGEVMAAAGKSIRWGLDSYNPEVPRMPKDTNQDWLLRELDDLEGAIRILRKALTGKAE